MAKLPTAQDVRRSTPSFTMPRATLDASPVVDGMRAQARGMQRFGQGIASVAQASEAFNAAEEKRIINEYDRKTLKLRWETEQDADELKRNTPLGEMQGFEDRVHDNFKGKFDAMFDEAPDWVKPRLEERGLNILRSQVTEATNYATEARSSYAFAEGKQMAETGVYAEAMRATSLTAADKVAAEAVRIMAGNPDLSPARKAELQILIETQAARGKISGLDPQSQINLAEYILDARQRGDDALEKAGRIFRHIPSDELAEMIENARGDLDTEVAFGAVDTAQGLSEGSEENAALTYTEQADLIDEAVRDGTINADQGKLAQTELKRRAERQEIEEAEAVRQEYEFIYEQITELHEKGDHEGAMAAARRARDPKSHETLMRYAQEGIPVVGNSKLYQDLNRKILLGTEEDLQNLDLRSHATQLSAPQLSDLEAKYKRELEDQLPSGAPGSVRPKTSTFNGYIKELGLEDEGRINDIADHATAALDRAWREKGEKLTPDEENAVLREVFKTAPGTSSWSNLWTGSADVSVKRVFDKADTIDGLRDVPVGTTRAEAVQALRRNLPTGTVVTPQLLDRMLDKIQVQHGL